MRLITLSDFFFDSYSGCTEILQKRSRPYACLEVFVGSESVSIEQREFDALKGKEHRIVSGMRKYLAVYKKSVQYADNPRYERIRSCSTLQYFHKELRLTE